MPTYTNRAFIEHDIHTMKVGRTVSLADNTATPVTAKATTSKRHYVRKGRKSYVEAKFSGRRS